MTASFARVARRRRPIDYLAAAVFSCLWLFLSQTIPVWHEGVSVYPAPATPVLAVPTAEARDPRFEPSCADAGPLRVISSSVRPQVAVCFRGRQYPLQITSYASGIPYWASELLWPLHKGRVFRLQAIGWLLGLWILALTRRLLERFADRTTADVAVLCVAVTPAFLFLHSTLIHYEILPWLALAAALDRLSRYRALAPDARDAEEPVPNGAVVAAAALVGLALISDIKAVFLIGPLFLLALRARVRFSMLRPRQWLLAALVLGAVLCPSIAGNALNAGADLSRQVTGRLQTLVTHLDPRRFIEEIPGVAVFWGDTLLAIVLASGDYRPPSIPGVAVTIPALFYCLVAAVVYLARGRGPLVPAACGLMIGTFFAVSALLYAHYPNTNYAPLNAIFGVAMATTIVDSTRWASARLGWPAAATRGAALAIVCAALIWSIVGRGSPTHFAAISINAAAERQLGSYLSAHPEPQVPLFVTTYILTGVPEAVTGGAVRTVKAYNYFDCPPGRNQVRTLDAAMREEGRRCLRDRCERLLRTFDGPIRLLVPLKSEPVENAVAAELGPVLEGVAGAQRRSFAQEATFGGVHTGPLIRLVRIGAPSEGGSSRR